MPTHSRLPDPDWRTACHALMHHTDPAQLFAGTLALANQLGFEFAAVRVAIPNTKEPRNVFGLNNLPPAWDAVNLRDDNPLYKMVLARRSTITFPFDFWPSVYQPWADAVRAIGIEAGMLFPIHHAGLLSVHTFARRAPWRDATEVSHVVPRLDYLAHTVDRVIVPLVQGGLAPVQLNAREVDVLRLAAEGFTAKDTARLLNMAKDTVEYHRKQATAKLGAENLIQAACLAVTLGIFLVADVPPASRARGETFANPPE